MEILEFGEGHGLANVCPSESPKPALGKKIAISGKRKVGSALWRNLCPGFHIVPILGPSDRIRDLKYLSSLQFQDHFIAHERRQSTTVN
jgi:hypothetical protein